jgi:hypothetical protein
MKTFIMFVLICGEHWFKMDRDLHVIEQMQKGVKDLTFVEKWYYERTDKGDLLYRKERKQQDGTWLVYWHEGLIAA